MEPIQRISVFHFGRFAFAPNGAQLGNKLSPLSEFFRGRNVWLTALSRSVADGLQFRENMGQQLEFMWLWGTVLAGTLKFGGQNVKGVPSVGDESDAPAGALHEIRDRESVFDRG